jgi:hypothetical protein
MMLALVRVARWRIVAGTTIETFAVSASDIDTEAGVIDDAAS